MEILYEYLKSILYDIDIKVPDLSALDGIYREFGESLKVLHGYVEETRACMEETPGALGLMISRIKEREARLKAAEDQLEKEKEVLESYRGLVGLTQKQKEWILVVDAERKDVVYCNKRELQDSKSDESQICRVCENRLSFYDSILDRESVGQSDVWEIKDGINHHYYKVTTFPMEWKNRKANAHILKDITHEKTRTNTLKNKAYHDALTGVYNRIYFEEYMENLLREKEPFNLGYLDLDCLKTVNDRYGHAEGDIYIQRFVSAIRRNFRTTDIFCRVGGDEFCLILKGGSKSVVEAKLQRIMEEFRSYDDKEYIHGFSFGVVEVEGGGAQTLKEIIHEADSAMYECKRRNKEFYRRRQEEDKA